MKYFGSVDEKGKYYAGGDVKIDKFADLLEILEKYDVEKALFRGQPEAKFMLYSSLQRLWIEKQLQNHYESYRHLIDNLIQNSKSWNFGLITKYLKNAGWQENDMSILSIMQHYGVPTPLLDFTYDINKSLFFATENIDFSPPNSEIDRYFSIYYMHKKNSVLSMSEMFINEALKYAKENDVIKKKDLDTTMQFDIALIDNSDEAYRIQNNLNILNQEGAFIFNSSPVDPLEVHYYKWVNLFNSILKKRGDKITPPNETFGCININKKLKREIRDFLKKKGIDRYSMFPDLNRLRIDCLNSEWGRISQDRF